MISLLDLLFTGAAAALWYVRPELGPWPLLLVAAGVAARALSPRQAAFRRTPFDGAILLFLLAVLMGLALSYDQAAAWDKFWITVAALALYYSIALAPARVALNDRVTFSPIRLLLGALPAVIALYFLLTNPWLDWASKTPSLTPLLTWLASWQPPLPGHRLHPNVAGGLLAALLPLQVAALGRRWTAVPLVGLTGLGLLLSFSRGAWLGVLAAAVLWVIWQLVVRWPARWSRAARAALWGGLFLALAIVVGAAAMAVCGESCRAGIAERQNLLLGAAHLASDYPFTGLGFGWFTFRMAYSSYGLLVHVGHTVHAHNFFLDLWLELGIAGVIAILWALIAALGVRARSPWRAGALLALAVMMVHGLVDDTFFGSRGLLLLWLPFGVLAWAAVPRKAAAAARHSIPALAVVIGTLIVVLAVLVLPAGRAELQANLGALAQTRAELSRYQWPTWPIQDELRRTGASDLAPAVARYRAALAADADNVTANRRLGQIELSLSQYEAARQHLEAAYRAAPGQRATRQMLGEVYAIAGDLDGAAALWRTIKLREGQLDIRVWWYDHIGEPENAQRIRDAAGLAGL